jgi:hypothetical protein
MNDINITCVAFHGKKTPAILESFITSCLHELRNNLGSCFTEVFIPYTPYQIHATIIGLEVDVIDGKLYSHWAINNTRGKHQPVTIDALITTLSRFGDTPLIIRFCGYAEARCSCTGEEYKEWDCPTSKGEFHSCGRTGYEGSFYGFSPGPAVITGWPVVSPRSITSFPHTIFSFRKECENAGFLDKYHSDSHPYWRDDDCYIKIGSFTRKIEDLPEVTERMRNFLAIRDPVILELSPEQVEIILYQDTSLSEISIIKKLPLIQAIKKPDSLKQMFEYVKTHKMSYGQQ